jgi:hypothetical protein
MIRKEADDSSEGTGIPDANSEMPRKVHFDSLSAKALSLALLMLLFGMAILTWISYGIATNLRTRQVLSQSGRTVDADIQKIIPNRGGELVQYTFLADGRLYSGQAEMATNHYTLPGDPKKLFIGYLPNDPRVNQPVKWRWTSVWDFAPFLLLLSITAIGASILLKALRLRALMRTGTVAAGKVTGCAPDKKLFTVYYNFNAADDTSWEGRCTLEDEYDVGSSLPIIYLPTDPKGNSCYPVPGFRIS